MVENIYKMKNQILQQAEKELAERGPERIDVNRMGELVDMVKDLAEAEESCWKAQYYRKVTEAMEGSSGYTPMNDGNMARQGYGSMSRQGYGSMGYSMGHDDLIEKLGKEYAMMTPDEKMSMKSKLLSKLN